MWQDYELPTTAEINGVSYDIRTDYRAILDILAALNDPDLADFEKLSTAMQIFYVDYDSIEDVQKAAKLMMVFINGNKEEDPRATKNKKPLMDWEQDLPIIIAPINRILGKEIRSVEYLHWWSFLSAFMEIGECTFNTYVGIRSKLNEGKKLEKYEEKLLKDSRDKIVLKKKVDSSSQAFMDEIMGL